MTEQISKLPKWARHRIAKAESDVVYYKDKAMAVTSKKGTDVRVSQSLHDAPLFLPTGTEIEFLLNDRDSISVRRQEDGIHVYVTGGHLAFWPECTNVGTLKVVQR